MLLFTNFFLTTTPWERSIITLFHRWGNWGTRRSGNLSKLTQLVSGEPGLNHVSDSQLSLSMTLQRNFLCPWLGQSELPQKKTRESQGFEDLRADLCDRSFVHSFENSTGETNFLSKMKSGMKWQAAWKRSRAGAVGRTRLSCIDNPWSWVVGVWVFFILVSLLLYKCAHFHNKKLIFFK